MPHLESKMMITAFDRQRNPQTVLERSTLVDAAKWVPSVDQGSDNNNKDDSPNMVMGGTPLCLHLEKDGLRYSRSLGNAKTLEEASVRTQLRKAFDKYQSKTLKSTERVGPAVDCDMENHAFTPLQWQTYQYIAENNDLLYPLLNENNQAEMINVLALHTLNLVVQTRDIITKNNDRLEAASDGKSSTQPPKKRSRTSSTAAKKPINEEEMRDQGFTRPKVLILCPFRSGAVDIVNALCQISGSTHVDGMDKFEEGFGVEEDAMDERKPADFKELFKGNIDDCFKIGIKFMKKKMKLFSPFYTSDIIIASPLGLKLVIGADGDEKQDFDFLSSIEMLWMQNADVFLMQNWEHVRHIMTHLNLKPKEAHGCDFSRVRSYYLDGKAKYVRQTVICSRMVTPEIANVFSGMCFNIAGKIKVEPKYSGEITKTRDLTTVPTQVFYRVPGDNVADINEKRFQYFTKQVLPQLTGSVASRTGTLLFLPSYFDFVRVRNYLMDHRYEFGALSEYTPVADIARIRGSFFRGETPILLCTERFYFFRRYQLRGIRHAVFYALPEYSQFYTEIVAMVSAGSDSNGSNTTGATTSTSSSGAAGGRVSVYITVLDRLRVERVVGTRRATKMLASLQDSFVVA